MKKRNSTTTIACLLFFIFFFVLHICLSPLSRSNTSHSSKEQAIKRSEMLTKTLMKVRRPPCSESSPARQINCDRMHRRYDLCTINGPTVLDSTTSSFHLMNPTSSEHRVEKIRPYPRKWENFSMAKIKEVTITSGLESPPCAAQHNAPALVFSAGGYTGNFFHDFNDGFIPLFITVSSLYPNNQDFVLVISKARDWWVSKYADLLRTFSKHPIVNLDNDTSTHCFTSANLGLISHGFMTVDPKLMPSPRTLTHFRSLLNGAYGHVSKYRYDLNYPKLKPRLVLVSRNGAVGRVILNQNEVKQVAQEVGFEVIVFEPTPRTPLHDAYALINSSHAMVGVHGAALTHFLFLRPRTVFMQVVPLGTESVAEICFASAARSMGLEYMEYKVRVEESSLIDKYDRNSLLIKDPVAFQGKNWSSSIMDIYLKEQNVRLDVVRMRGFLREAYKMANIFVGNEEFLAQLQCHRQY